MNIFIIHGIVSLFTLQRSESLYIPQPFQSTSRCTVLMRHQSNDRCDCCSDDDDDEGCNALLVELPKPSSIPIHTSRRKFIQYTTTLGIAGVSSSSSYAETISDASRFDQSKNIIAVPGQLPPFSTTRKYRNIVLSNGLKVILVKDLRCTSSSVAISIDGAGQFAEPDEIPGLAHLMEHIILSSTRGGRRSTKILNRRPRDFWNKGSKTIREEDTTESESFEDWLIDNDGDSNAFTAPGFVCFHFNSPHEVLPEALERFSKLFTLDEVETTLSKPSVIPREIGRVADELDRTSDLSRSIYFLKNSINPDHPFARFSAGSIETLQTIPNEEGIDVSSELARFFRDHYLSSKATLVVVGKDELSTLDRWISPFSNVMSQKVGLTEKLNPPLFPDPLLGSNKQAIILRNTIDDVQVDENYQTLCMEWPLSLTYDTTNIGYGSSSLITATSLGFILTQIISRRGPGSLRQFLEKLGWVPRGNKGVPRISFPVDVNGFQIMRLEIGGITLDGFANRSALVSTVFESIRKTSERPLQDDLIKEYLVAAQLHGYFFAPRAADAITLSVDSLRFGSGGTNGVANEDYNWYLMPSPDDGNSVLQMKQLVTETLYTMSDESSSLVSFRASPKAVFTSSQGIIDERISTPPVFLPWQREPITGTRFYQENRASGASSYLKSLEWFASVFDGEELSPPYLNPLLPTRIRSPRPIIERQVGQWGGSRYLYQDASDDDNLARSSGKKLKLTNAQTWREYTSGFSVDSVESRWRLFLVPPNKASFIGLPLPLRPPENSVECAFVVQLLSSLPSTWSSSDLALSNLWLLSFDDEILDLAELGAVAGIAYETSGNTSGLRLSFRGVSQTLPSYVRRFCRRFVRHHVHIFEGTSQVPSAVFERAISDASRSPLLDPLQRQQVIDTVNQSSDKDIARKAKQFLESTSGGYLISQGDILPTESSRLLTDLQDIFKDYGTSNEFTVQPEVRALLYRPFWKPRSSSPCLLPGINLISDSCGRIPR